MSRDKKTNRNKKNIRDGDKRSGFERGTTVGNETFTQKTARLVKELKASRAKEAARKKKVGASQRRRSSERRS